MPRILILHASVGSGHRSAALALKGAFLRRPSTEVRVEDALDHATPLFREAYRRSYLDLTKRAPMLWQLFYQNTDVSDPELIDLSNRLRSLVEGLGTLFLHRLVRSYKPAAIVCTHFLPVELLLRRKEEGRLPPPVYCVVTDFVAHSFWLTSGLDGYFVASDLTRRLMIERGVNESLIHVSGIPINLAIAEPKSTEAVRTACKLPLDQPVITLFGGGVQTQRLRHIVAGLLKSALHGTLIVIAGRNEELVGALSRLRSSAQLQLQVLGHIAYVDDLIAASDLVITKAGGLIVSEVLARGTPMLIIDPIPGQEEWNADYVSMIGAAVQLRMVETAPYAVQQLLAAPERLAAMRQAATSAGHPRAAIDIADHVLRGL